jgi:hypothetical protein
VYVVTMAYLIDCELPARPLADGSSPAKGSADNVVVVTLRFARRSFFMALGSKSAAACTVALWLVTLDINTILQKLTRCCHTNNTVSMLLPRSSQ